MVSGRSNHGDALYANRLRALITSWRQLWGQGDFPFYFVQLAPLGTVYAPGELVDLCTAQASCLDLANTGMAVTNDIGDLATIHPKDKKDVGDRLARIALAKEYAQPGIVYSGPPIIPSSSTEPKSAWPSITGTGWRPAMGNR